MLKGIYPPKGFLAAGVHSGLKPENQKDLALIVSESPCEVAGVFTTNRVKAAPVLYDQEIVHKEGPIRAVVINAGNANACTGARGLEDTRTMATRVASGIGCYPDEVLVLSTGVIGVQLPMDRVLPGIDKAVHALTRAGWQDAAEAIMTTDTRPKVANIRSTKLDYAVAGLAKGSGMVAPHMATMLSVVVTDAHAGNPFLQRNLSGAMDQTFNRIVVDGDMSTNDTVIVLSNGQSGESVERHAPEDFRSVLRDVCGSLAREIVRDGEGATKFITLQVTGAKTEADAVAVARAIATSQLCKTAFYGGDPNWGRILCAAGYAGVSFIPEDLSLWFKSEDEQNKIQLVEGGQPTNYDEEAAIALMQAEDWSIQLDIGKGSGSSLVWTCDLSHEYVTINSHYRT